MFSINKIIFQLQVPVVNLLAFFLNGLNCTRILSIQCCSPFEVTRIQMRTCIVTVIGIYIIGLSF